jgi:hypothetical protein
MIITLKGADFSSNNIGTLSTWTIFTSIGKGATYEGVRTVDKGASFSALVTIADGYEIGTAGVSVMMGTADITSTAVKITVNEIEITIGSVTGNVTISVPTINTATGEEGGGDVVEPDADPEIGTTTTFGSDNTTVTIIGKFNDFKFVDGAVVSTSSGSSCKFGTGTARAASNTQVLKVSGGEAVAFTQVISGLQYALIEFTDKPCVQATLNKSGFYGQAWSTDATCNLHANTKYVTINFNRGSGSFTTDELAKLKTAITLS